MRRFFLKRTEDVSGTSGTGYVAEGVEFHDGKVAMCWFGNLHSMAIYEDVATLIGIHGHDGRTTVMWEDAYPLQKPDERTVLRVSLPERE